MFLTIKVFSITGVVVASTIGVIAMTGMAKHMALIAQQQQKINKERELNAFWEQFGTQTSCQKTIENWLNQNTPNKYPAPSATKKAKLAEGTQDNHIEIQIIKKADNTNLLDVHDSNNIFSRYGFFPRFFVLRCNLADNGGSCDCRTSAHTYSGGACKKTWMLIPGIQKGMTFIRGRLLTVDIEWSSAPNSTYTNFTCTEIGTTGGKNRCYKAEATGSRRTLAGCGSTQSLGGTGTTAFGNDVARSATIAGANNLFLGAGAGLHADVRSGADYNVFIGSEAGRANTSSHVSGDNNVFVGHGTGQFATVSGKWNAFVGERSGSGAKVSGNSNMFFGRWAGDQAKVPGTGHHFFGSQAGYKTKITSGAMNTFVGTNSGREATISSGGNHFFGDNAGKKATVSGGQNHFIGDHAGKEATVSGTGNDFFGYHAGDKATVRGNTNLFLGDGAGRSADIRSGANGNVFIGNEAGKKNHGTTTGGYISGDLNVFLGHAAGRTAKVSGNYNTLIGAGAGGTGQTISGNGGTYIKGGKIEIKAPDVKVKAQGWLCPAGQTLRGFDTSGNKVCIATGGTGWKQTCPVGDVLRGFNSAGNKVCALQDKCMPGYYWNGSRCMTRCGGAKPNWSSPLAKCVSACSAQQYWDGSQCKNRCQASHRWDGSQCVHRCPNNWSVRDQECKSCSYLWNESCNHCQPRCASSHAWEQDRCSCIYQGTGRSSKVYKKNIRPFNDMEKALKDIIDTPLFTYYFKDKDNFPKKKRMGVIAEDLPKSLQLKGKPVSPDWPSIYGTLWAGIKALHSKIESFKKDVLSKFKTLNSTIEAKFKALSKTDDQFKKELANTKQELKEATAKLQDNTKELKSANEKIDSLSKELKELKSSFEKTGLRDPDKQPIR